jgi:hypothetical protein
MRRSELVLRLLSIAIAIGLLVVVRGGRRVSAAYVVPVQADVPERAIAQGAMPDEVTVVVSGAWARLRVLDAAELGPVRIEVPRNARGTVTWRARPEALHLPPGARVESITPAQGSVELRRDVR